jgi:hypothetical protein
LLRDNPLQNRLHRSEPGILGLPNNRKQLKPQIVIRAIKKFANRAGYEIYEGHGGFGCAMLELPCDIGIQRRHDVIRDIRTIKLRYQLSQHGRVTAPEQSPSTVTILCTNPY